MKKMLTLAAIVGLVCAGLLTGCQKQEDTTSMMPSTNAATDMPTTNEPDMSSTNAPAMPSTNAP